MEISQCKIINDFYILLLQGKFFILNRDLTRAHQLTSILTIQCINKTWNILDSYPSKMIILILSHMNINEYHITSSSRIYQSQGLWLDSMGYSYLQLKFALLCLKIIKLYIECFPRQILSCSSIGDFLHQP